MLAAGGDVVLEGLAATGDSGLLGSLGVSTEPDSDEDSPKMSNWFALKALERRRVPTGSPASLIEADRRRGFRFSSDSTSGAAIVGTGGSVAD